MIKTMMLASILAGEPEMASQKEHRKLKNFAVSAAFIVVVNAIVFAPFVKTSLQRDE